MKSVYNIGDFATITVESDDSTDVYRGVIWANDTGLWLLGTHNNDDEVTDYCMGMVLIGENVAEGSKVSVINHTVELTELGKL